MWNISSKEGFFLVYEKKEEWPEKYGINKLLSIDEDIYKITRGDKISVRRNDRYADIGDELVLNGHLFEITNVYPQFLKNVTDKNAREEGYDCLNSYKEALTSIHETAVWDPEQLVWAHYLKEK